MSYFSWCANNVGEFYTWPGYMCRQLPSIGVVMLYILMMIGFISAVVFAMKFISKTFTEIRKELK